jgi:hypothetical protein
MAICCPDCGREYDVTLFQFGSTVACDCGSTVRALGNRPSARAAEADPRARPGAPAAVDPFGGEPVAMPIDGTLDLHTFQPSDVKDLVPDYLDACRDAGILRVRIVHGKGTGALLQTVHAILERTPGIESFALADAYEGGWGATIVVLKPGR